MPPKFPFLCGAGLLAFIGVFLSLVSVSWCEFVDMDLPGGKTASFGPWRWKSFVWLIDNNGNRWKIDTCEQLPDDWDLDAKWKMARAAGIIAPILGALGGGSTYLSGAGGGVGLLLAALFQGLTLLFLNSDACDTEVNPALRLVERFSPGDYGDCELSRSGIMSIVAMGCFFVGSLIACAGSAFPDDDDESPPKDQEGEPEEAAE